jgi:hypothetical protein
LRFPILFFGLIETPEMPVRSNSAVSGMLICTDGGCFFADSALYNRISIQRLRFRNICNPGAKAIQLLIILPAF